MTKQVKLVLALLVGAVVLFYLLPFLLLPKGSTDQGAVAVVKQNGTVLAEIDLTALSQTYTLPVEGKNGLWNRVVAQQGRICVEEASCPDQVCVRQGWISDSSLPIVCLPNKLVIEIVGKEGAFDVGAK